MFPKLNAITKFILDKFFYCLLFYITYAWKGYGDMVCRTPAGRIFSIFFIVSSVPMWFNILAQLGYFLHLLLFKLWTAFRCFLCGTGYHFRGSVYVYLLDAATSSRILKAKQKLIRTFNFDKLGGIAFTKISKLTMCSA